MDDNFKQDIREMIAQEMSAQRAKTNKILRWFIGAFGILIIALAVNFGMYKVRFSNTESTVKNLDETAVRSTGYRYQLTEYRVDYMWNEDRGLPPPDHPTLTRGGNIPQ